MSLPSGFLLFPEESVYMLFVINATEDQTRRLFYVTRVSMVDNPLQ